MAIFRHYDSSPELDLLRDPGFYPDIAAGIRNMCDQVEHPKTETAMRLHCLRYAFLPLEVTQSYTLGL